MKFDFKSPPPVVQEKKKYANFTIREIGGPAEIGKWRAEQALKESKNERLRLAKIELQKELMSAGLPEGNGVTWDGKATVGSAGWSEKLEHALSERKRLSEESTPEPFQWVPDPEPHLNPLQKIVRWVKGIWMAANF